jgi:hypothetical protein
MIEKTKCRNCGAVYELIWDDTEMDDWRDDFEDTVEQSDEEFETSDPAYCPFCGTHCDYDE